jgi:hypothetical protein
MPEHPNTPPPQPVLLFIFLKVLIYPPLLVSQAIMAMLILECVSMPLSSLPIHVGINTMEQRKGLNANQQTVVMNELPI